MERGLRGCAKDFPLIEANPQLHYLDSAASSQKPKAVIESLSRFYSCDYANVHRGSYELSQRATSLYEGARSKIASFLGLKSDRQVIFTKGTTDGVNIVMQALAKKHQETPMSGAVLVLRSEHHANFVPWQQLAKTASLPFLIAELTSDKRQIDLDHFSSLVSLHKPSVVAISSSSNVLGNSHPWRQMAKIAKNHGALVFLDLAQSVAHDPVNFSKDEDLVDFAVFSAHKIFGPTGIGILWGKAEHLESLEPTHFGGDMISLVGDHSTTWNELPWKWEPGTPAIAEAVGFGAAIDYFLKFDRSEVLSFEHNLCAEAIKGLWAIEGVEIYGVLDAKLRAPLVTFNLKGVHSLDLATWLDQRGLALRSGHHCAQPLHRSLGVESSIRASFSIYNDLGDVRSLIEGVADAASFFTRLKHKGAKK